MPRYGCLRRLAYVVRFRFCDYKDAVQLTAQRLAFGHPDCFSLSYYISVHFLFHSCLALGARRSGPRCRPRRSRAAVSAAVSGRARCRPTAAVSGRGVGCGGRAARCRPRYIVYLFVHISKIGARWSVVGGRWERVLIIYYYTKARFESLFFITLSLASHSPTRILCDSSSSHHHLNLLDPCEQFCKR